MSNKPLLSIKILFRRKFYTRLWIRSTPYTHTFGKTKWLANPHPATKHKKYKPKYVTYTKPPFCYRFKAYTVQYNQAPPTQKHYVKLRRFIKITQAITLHLRVKSKNPTAKKERKLQHLGKTHFFLHKHISRIITLCNMTDKQDWKL